MIKIVCSVFVLIACSFGVIQCHKKFNKSFKGYVKLTEKEMIERAGKGIWPDVFQVTYISHDGDTISYDSLIKLDYDKIAFDDYVDESGLVKLAVIRDMTPRDSILRINMEEAYNKWKTEIFGSAFATYKMTSPYLKSPRELSVYMPPNKRESTPIFYIADGQTVEIYALKIDPLIRDNKIEPIILVGLHSDFDLRYEEYVWNEETRQIFENFQLFFEEILIRFDSISTNRNLYGFSNGAAFCIYTALKNPDLFNRVLAFSNIGFNTNINLFDLNKDIYSRLDFHFAVGIEEDLVLEKNQVLINILQENGIRANINVFEGGHDHKKWDSLFIDYLVDAYSR